MWQVEPELEKRLGLIIEGCLSYTQGNDNKAFVTGRPLILPHLPLFKVSSNRLSNVRTRTMCDSLLYPQC